MQTGKSFKRITTLLSLTALLAAPAAAQGFTLTLQPTGNTTRFIVRETFVNVPTPFDATGTTEKVTGQIVFDAQGKVVAGSSKITVDLTSLATDNESRDRQFKRQTLETQDHPNAVLVPTGTEGLASPIPTSGSFTFTLLGNLTIRNVTKPTRWQVTANATPNGYTGTAKTTITFENFELTKPRSARVLSVVDEIKLEYDFSFARQSSSTP